MNEDRIAELLKETGHSNPNVSGKANATLFQIAVENVTHLLNASNDNLKAPGDLSIRMFG